MSQPGWSRPNTHTPLLVGGDPTPTHHVCYVLAWLVETLTPTHHFYNVSAWFVDTQHPHTTFTISRPSWSRPNTLTPLLQCPSSVGRDPISYCSPTIPIYQPLYVGIGQYFNPWLWKLGKACGHVFWLIDDLIFWVINFLDISRTISKKIFETFGLVSQIS